MIGTTHFLDQVRRCFQLLLFAAPSRLLNPYLFGSVEYDVDNNTHFQQIQLYKRYKALQEWRRWVAICYLTDVFRLSCPELADIALGQHLISVVFNLVHTCISLVRVFKVVAWEVVFASHWTNHEDYVPECVVQLLLDVKPDMV